MKSSAELQAEIREVSDQMRPLGERLHALNAALRDAKSREWISANGVTRENVQPDRGDGIPWHWDVFKFGEWLRDTGCRKRWAVWNGRLQSTAELMAGRYDPEAPGLAEHVPG